MLGHIWTSCFSASATITMHCYWALQFELNFLDFRDASCHGIIQARRPCHKLETRDEAHWPDGTQRAAHGVIPPGDTGTIAVESTARVKELLAVHTLHTCVMVKLQRMNMVWLSAHENANHGLAFGDGTAEHIMRIGIHNATPCSFSTKTMCIVKIAFWAGLSSWHYHSIVLKSQFDPFP